MKYPILLPLVAIIFTACNQSNQASNQDEAIANTEINSVAFPLSNIDSSASACDDFYQYAIGGWLEENPIPSTDSRWSSFNVLQDSNEAKLKKILIEYSTQENAVGSMPQKIGDFYKSVMDSAAIEVKGFQPILKDIDAIKNLSSKAELEKLLANHRSMGVNSLFGLYVGQDDKNSEQYITFLYQSGLGLPDRDYYTNTDQKSEEIKAAYKTHIVTMFELMEEANANSMAEKAYEIEHALAEASMTRVERRDPEKTYNKYTVSKLQEEFPNIDWSIYMSSIGIEGADEVIVGQPDFFRFVNDFMTSSDLEDMKAYLQWRLLDAYASDLSHAFVEQNFDFYSRTLSGAQEMKPRWKRALRKVNGNIGQLLGKAFVERHFPEESKADVARMVENLRDVFRERINALDWMSAETKVKAIEKLEAFDKKIGYPKKWRDFGPLEITADNLMQNVKNARIFNFNYMINKLGKPVDKDEWFMTPQTVNAYYSSSKNEIVFPAGILQPPFYSPDADDAINYGGIGAVIGHEFTHGFDDQGSKYDAKGNLANWWTDEDRKRFEERAQKVIDQFDGFEPIDSLNVNGKLTLGENIADLGGATLAFHALEKELASKGAPEPIDGFTYQQRFFLGWAQVWHMNMTEKELRKRIATDPHSPGEYRVNGPLANMNEFAEAFGCDEHSPMVNPDSLKAVIW